MLTDLKCKDFGSEEKQNKLFYNFIESGLEKISTLDTGASILAKREVSRYINDQPVLETNLSLINSFNIEFASTSFYSIPFFDLPWSDKEGKNVPAGIQEKMISLQLKKYFDEEKKDFQILKPGLSNDTSKFIDILKNEESICLGKDLILLYVPFIESKNTYKLEIVSSIILNSLKQFYFIHDKVFIMKIDSSFKEIEGLKEGLTLNGLDFNFKFVEINDFYTYLVIY